MSYILCDPFFLFDGIFNLLPSMLPCKMAGSLIDLLIPYCILHSNTGFIALIMNVLLCLLIDPAISFQ